MKLMLTKKARWMWIMKGKSFRVSSMLRSVQRSLLAKRIADAFVSGHEYYDFYKEGLFVKKSIGVNRFRDGKCHVNEHCLGQRNRIKKGKKLFSNFIILSKRADREASSFFVYQTGNAVSIATTLDVIEALVTV